MGFAQGTVWRNESVSTYQAEDERLHRESAATDFRVGNDNACLYEIAGGNLDLDAWCHDLQVHLRLGQFDRFEARTFQSLQEG